MRTTIDISCCLCGASHEQEIELPDGWALDTIGSKTGFCPSHLTIKDFADSQCRGCVGRWTDCSLWQAFAYRKHALTESDFRAIESGICPKRTGGTFSFSRGGEMEEIDLSEKSPLESGKALAKAIKDYWERYPFWRRPHEPR